MLLWNDFEEKMLDCLQGTDSTKLSCSLDSKKNICEGTISLARWNYLSEVDLYLYRWDATEETESLKAVDRMIEELTAYFTCEKVRRGGPYRAMQKALLEYKLELDSLNNQMNELKKK